MKYFISTLNFSPDSRENISKILPKMVGKKIHNIEISSFHPYEYNLDKKLLKFSNKFNVRLLLHNFIPLNKQFFLLNLCSKDKRIRNMTKKSIREAIKLTKKLGMDYYSFHAGFRVNYKTAIHDYKSRLNREEAICLFIKELRGIIKFAEDLGIHIGIENHVSIIENKDNLILYDIEDWNRLFREIPSRYFHLHLDLGHLKITSTEYNFSRRKFLRLFSKKVMAMHIHDNTGIKIDCHAPISKNFWFGRKEFKLFKNLKYPILETKTYANINTINNMIRILENKR